MQDGFQNSQLKSEWFSSPASYSQSITFTFIWKVLVSSIYQSIYLCIYRMNKIKVRFVFNGGCIQHIVYNREASVYVIAMEIRVAFYFNQPTRQID